MTNSADRRHPPRLRAHQIAPLPAGLGVGIGMLASAGVAHAVAVANPDHFTAVDRNILQNVGNVLTNDTGVAPLSVTYPTTAQSGSHGVGLISSTGDFQYLPSSCAPGAQDGFNYIMRDGDNTIGNTVVYVTLISPLVDDSYTTNAGAPITGNVRDNDLPSSNTLPVSSFLPAGTGTVAGDTTGTSSNGQFTYTPASGFSGLDSFAYTASDPALGGCSSNAVAQVMVVPVAASDTFSTPFATVLAGNVLDNDIGTNLIVTASTQPAHGIANVAADGSFNYVPAAGFSGGDSFTYTIQDGSGDGASAIGSVSISVGAAPAVATPATTPATLGLLATLLAWLGLRRRRET
ncbi:MAG: Ig-like domain-containing protein [Rhodanobacteraceae bacterium]